MAEGQVGQVLSAVFDPAVRRDDSSLGSGGRRTPNLHLVRFTAPDADTLSTSDSPSTSDNLSEYSLPAGLEGPRGFGLELQHALKRALDIAVSSLALLVLLPIFLLISLAIRLESPGPIFFRQQRMGRGGQLFEMWKFRSMAADAETRLAELRTLNEGNGPFFKMARDPRITRVGRWIRRTSFDELPQLLNVLKGEMSLVGPRPFLLSEYVASPKLFSWRLCCTPGITGPWQVAGCSKVPLSEAVELDRAYAERWNLALDLRLILSTVGTVIRQTIVGEGGTPTRWRFARRSRVGPVFVASEALPAS